MRRGSEAAQTARSRAPNGSLTPTTTEPGQCPGSWATSAKRDSDGGAVRDADREPRNRRVPAHVGGGDLDDVASVRDRAAVPAGPEDETVAADPVLLVLSRPAGVLRQVPVVRRDPEAMVDRRAPGEHDAAACARDAPAHERGRHRLAAPAA